MFEKLPLLLNVALTLSTILFLGLTYRMSRKRSEAEAMLERAKTYIKSLAVIDYLYQDVILLGPQDSGKTSVAKLWNDPTFDISDVSHTREWQPYARDVSEFTEYEKVHKEFHVLIKYKPRLRIVVHDYPGEDRYRAEAINRLPELKNPVLLLFFNVHADSGGIQKTHENNTYYSQAFVERLKKQGVSLMISKVVVVFSKADLLPRDMEPAQAIEELKRTNSDAVERIEGQFSGILDYRLVSAEDNRGLIALLGDAAAQTLPAESRKGFEAQVKKLSLGTKPGQN
jgi:hypothetical protein